MEENENKDPLFDNYCEDCGLKLAQLIKYVRQLENAQIAAKEALDTLSWANEKLTEQLDKEKERNKVLTQVDIKNKMDNLDNAQMKLVNRQKLGEE